MNQRTHQLPQGVPLPPGLSADSPIALPTDYLKRIQSQYDLEQQPRNRDGKPMPRVGSTFEAYGQQWKVTKVWPGRMQVKCVGKAEA